MEDKHGHMPFAVSVILNYHIMKFSFQTFCFLPRSGFISTMEDAEFSRITRSSITSTLGYR